MQIDHESRPQYPKLVHIRVYENAKDWWHKREITFPCTPSGSLDVEKLQCELEEKGRVRVQNSEGCIPGIVNQLTFPAK